MPLVRPSAQHFYITLRGPACELVHFCAASDLQRCSALTDGDDAEDAVVIDLGMNASTHKESLPKHAVRYSRGKNESTDKEYTKSTTSSQDVNSGNWSD